MEKPYGEISISVKCMSASKRRIVNIEGLINAWLRHAANIEQQNYELNTIFV